MLYAVLPDHVSVPKSRVLKNRARVNLIWSLRKQAPTDSWNYLYLRGRQKQNGPIRKPPDHLILFYLQSPCRKCFTKKEGSPMSFFDCAVHPLNAFNHLRLLIRGGCIGSGGLRKAPACRAPLPLGLAALSLLVASPPFPSAFPTSSPRAHAALPLGGGVRAWCSTCPRKTNTARALPVRTGRAAQGEAAPAACFALLCRCSVGRCRARRRLISDVQAFHGPPSPRRFCFFCARLVCSRVLVCLGFPGLAAPPNKHLPHFRSPPTAPPCPLPVPPTEVPPSALPFRRLALGLLACLAHASALKKYEQQNHKATGGGEP
jgi:hypothetical protein